jgi:hypothetical protein
MKRWRENGRKGLPGEQIGVSRGGEIAAISRPRRLKQHEAGESRWLKPVVVDLTLDKVLLRDSRPPKRQCHRAAVLLRLQTG